MKKNRAEIKKRKKQERRAQRQADASEEESGSQENPKAGSEESSTEEQKPIKVARSQIREGQTLKTVAFLQKKKLPLLIQNYSLKSHTHPTYPQLVCSPFGSG